MCFESIVKVTSADVPSDTSCTEPDPVFKSSNQFPLFSPLSTKRYVAPICLTMASLAIERMLLNIPAGVLMSGGEEEEEESKYFSASSRKKSGISLLPMKKRQVRERERVEIKW